MKVYQLAEKIRQSVEHVLAMLAEQDFQSSDAFAEVPELLAQKVIEANPVNTKPEACTLTSFKAFGHQEQRIPLKPLTLIFGPNSAGKSSFLHSQLWLHHAMTEGDLDVHRPSLAGDLVDLGGLRNVVYKKLAEGNTFTLRYSFAPSELSMPLRDLLGKMLDTLHFEFTVSAGKQLVVEEAGALPALMQGAINRVSISLGKNNLELLRLSRRRNGSFKIDNYPLTDPKFSPIWEELQAGLSFSAKFTDHEEAVLAQLFEWITANIELGPADSPLLPQKALYAGRKLKVSDAINELNPHYYAEEWEDHTPEHEEGNMDEEWSYQTGEDEYTPDPQDQGRDYPMMPDEDPSVDIPSQAEVDSYNDKKLKEALPNLIAAVESALGSLLGECRELVLSYLDTLHYLGSQRAYPERGFTFNTKRDANWKANGGEAWDRLVADPELRVRVNHWLQDAKHLKTPYKLAMRKFVDLEGTGRLIEEELDDAYNEASSGEVDLSGYDANDPESKGSRVDLMDWDSAQTAAQIKTRAATTGEVESYADLYLVDSNSNTIVSHRDVGVGITQLIPILATAMSLEGKTVMIEEPESHLHPKAQAELADVFIDSALGGGSKNSYIIETHSETLLLRILRRIRESSFNKNGDRPKITPEDVAFIYIDPIKGGAKALDVRIDERGRVLDSLPDGFFEEDFDELFGG